MRQQILRRACEAESPSQGEPFPATFPFVGKSRPCGANNKKLLLLNRRTRSVQLNRFPRARSAKQTIIAYKKSEVKLQRPHEPKTNNIRKTRSVQHKSPLPRVAQNKGDADASPKPPNSRFPDQIISLTVRSARFFRRYAVRTEISMISAHASIVTPRI